MVNYLLIILIIVYLQWRRFNFFDKETIKDESNETVEILKVINDF